VIVRALVLSKNFMKCKGKLITQKDEGGRCVHVEMYVLYMHDYVAYSEL